MKTFSASVISPPECEELVVECLVHNGEDYLGPWAEINHEGGRFSMIIYPRKGQESWEFTIEEFNQALAVLKDMASEVYDDFDSSLLHHPA